jgi:hypothetical protein
VVLFQPQVRIVTVACASTDGNYSAQVRFSLRLVALLSAPSTNLSGSSSCSQQQKADGITGMFEAPSLCWAMKEKKH